MCYQVIVSRDRRFDGKFYTGIVTTGVYCRPICPVKPANRKNMRFYPSAAAAEAAGFRACRRCHPEASPGTPDWLRASATVSRALRLISNGIFDEGGVEAVAARLGVGSRQLRRLFRSHLGATPAVVARARRLHFARRLLDETDLRVIDIAFSAGFSSLRQFNHSMRSCFGEAPQKLRRSTRERNRERCGDELTLRLPYRPPFDWATTIRFLRERATPGVEAISEDSYRRTVRIGGNAGMVEIRHDAGANALRLSIREVPYSRLGEVVEKARRVFDLGADPLVINEQLSRDSTMAPLVVQRPGLRVPGAWDAFELAIRAILEEHCSLEEAGSLAGCLAKRFGDRIEHWDNLGLTHVFPRAESLDGVDYSSTGVPPAAAQAIRLLAASVVQGRPLVEFGTDLEEAVANVRRACGIGEQAASYVAMRALGEPDAFTMAHLRTRGALPRGSVIPQWSALVGMALAWRPWRAYATMHLWAEALNGQKGA